MPGPNGLLNNVVGPNGLLDNVVGPNGLLDNVVGPNGLLDTVVGPIGLLDDVVMTFPCFERWVGGCLKAVGMCLHFQPSELFWRAYQCTIFRSGFQSR